MLVVFVHFDMKVEYKSLMKESEANIRDCYQKFIENQCDEPVEVLELECKKWKQCYHSEPTVKLTLVFTNVMAAMVRNTAEKLGVLCLVTLLVGMGIWAWRPSASSDKKLN